MTANHLVCCHTVEYSAVLQTLHELLQLPETAVALSKEQRARRHLSSVCLCRRGRCLTLQMLPRSNGKSNTMVARIPGQRLCILSVA